MTIDRRAIPPGAVEGGWIAPDGHVLRRIDLSPGDQGRSPDLGWLLFLPGRGDVYEKYLESLVHWRDRGWRVTSIDWRGQGGSGRLGCDSTTGHIDDFATWIADLAAFWRAERPAGRTAVVAHSMGGHLALRALAEGAIDPDALVLVAPMLGFAGPALPPRLLHLVAKAMTHIGPDTRPAWKISERPGGGALGRQSLLTSDDARYGDEAFWRAARPELVLGPGSWRWVERGYASFARLDRPGVLERVTTPVLLLGTTSDRLVSWSAIARAAARLPHAELVRYGREARHELLREIDAVRDDVLARIDRFLDGAGQ